MKSRLKITNLAAENHPLCQSNRRYASFPCSTHLFQRGKSDASFSVKCKANPAQRSSSLSWRHALNGTVFAPLLLTYFSSCNMNDDFPLPHKPSTDSVSGGSVSSCIRKAPTAFT